MSPVTRQSKRKPPKVAILTLELSPEQAAGLKRFTDKVGYSEAMAVLYPHVAHELRSEQVSQILAGFRVLEKALIDIGVSDWPWISTGRVR